MGAWRVLYNWGTANIIRSVDTADAGVPADQAEQVRVAGEAVNVAANLYTSGQFLGVLLVMLLGAIMVTNEFFHLTATTTFLVTPHRERVVLAKLAAAVLLGLVFWLVTTVLNLIVVPFVLNALDVRRAARRAGDLAGHRAERAGVRALGDPRRRRRRADPQPARRRR